MDVLVTGATGFIGSAALRSIEKRGHAATIVARSQQDADAFKARGHNAQIIDLTDLSGLRDIARNNHAVIHCAASDNPDFWPISERAATAMIEGLPDGAGFATHGGTILFGQTGTTPEAPRTFAPPPPLVRRSQVDKHIEHATGDRLATVFAYGAFVYGGQGAALPGLMKASARKMGVACYPGDGSGLWSSVHVDDFGALLVDGIENAGAGHHRVFAADATVSIKDAAEATGRALSLPVRSVDGEETRRAFGFFAQALSGNQCYSAAPAKTICGWEPERSSFQAFAASFSEEA